METVDATISSVPEQQIIRQLAAKNLNGWTMFSLWTDEIAQQEWLKAAGYTDFRIVSVALPL